MKDTTKRAIAAIAAADETMTKADIAAMLETRGGETEKDRVISAAEVAKILGKDRHTVRRYARAGLIRRITPPGFARAIGYSRKSIMDFMNRGNWEVA
jgi:hypothetical protein